MLTEFKLKISTTRVSWIKWKIDGRNDTSLICRHKNSSGFPRHIQKELKHMSCERSFRNIFRLVSNSKRSSDYRTRLEKCPTTRLDNLLRRIQFPFVSLRFERNVFIKLTSSIIRWTINLSDALRKPHESSISRRYRDWHFYPTYLGQQTKHSISTTRLKVWRKKTWRNIDSDTRLLRCVLFMM